MKVNKAIVTLLSISVILNAAISIVGPFFPPEAEKKGIDNRTTSYIFSAYPMAFVAVSLITPTALNFVNQKVLFVCSAIVYAVAVSTFGMVMYMDRQAMIIVGFISRILQGSSNAVLYTITYSIFSNEYDGKDFTKVNSIFKGTIGGGMLIGLVIGTLLYMVGGYMLPYCVYAFFMLCMIPFGVKLIPSRPPAPKLREPPMGDDENLDAEAMMSGDTHDTELRTLENDEPRPSKNQRKKMNPFKLVYHLLKNRTILKCVLLAAADLMLLNFSPAILSKRLTEMHIQSEYFAVFFALPLIFPVVSAVMVIKMFDIVENNYILCFGKFLMCISFALIGPSPFLGMHESIWAMLAGISILGFSASFAVLPLMPSIMDEIKNKFQRHQQNYIDTASSLYNCGFGIGSIIGPMLGAHLNSYFGFRTCCDILSAFAGILFLILLVVSTWSVMARMVKYLITPNRKSTTDAPSYGALDTSISAVPADQTDI